MEEDLEQIQCDLKVAHQKLQEDASVKLKVVRVSNKKLQDQEDQKWKEEDWKKKDEEDQKVRKRPLTMP